MIDIYLITDKMTQFHIIHYLNELYIICSNFGTGLCIPTTNYNISTKLLLMQYCIS